jgi:Immunoglobulin domain
MIVNQRLVPLAGRLRGATAFLLLFLERSPAVRVVADAVAVVVETPAGLVLKAAAGTLAAMGAVDSLAGATSSSGGGGAASAYLVTDVSLPANVAVGQAFKMDVTVSGVGVTYAKSWTVSNTLPPGITVLNGTLSGNNIQISDDTAANGVLTISGTPTAAGTYNFTVSAYQNTNYGGAVTSGSTSIVVAKPSGTAPSITTQPASQTVNAGTSVTFKVVASATPAPTYQWQKGGSAISGATGTTFTIASAQVADAGTYNVVVTNTAGSTTSANAVLTVNNVAQVPAFTAQPVSQTIAPGSTVVFKALATGAPAPTYQWSVNNVAIAGATNPNLVVSAASFANQGTYTCTASNAAGSTVSAVANLSVLSTNNVGRLMNVSCLANVGTGADILISGFVVGGGTAGNGNLLIRASGPALAPFNITSPLPDPELQLTNETTGLQIDQNTGWQGSSSIVSAASAVGAFAWTSPSSHDAALLESLSPGPYTASLLGQSGDTGPGLIEVYDTTPAGSYNPSMNHVLNISARHSAGTGANVLTAGFVIGGLTSKTVLIRASGPALAQYGVSGTLADPYLEVHDQNAQKVIATNSAWGGDLDIAGAASQVGAFPWQFTTSNDSAVLITLPPGPYTAVVSGASGDSGIALIEVYEVP